MQKSLLICPAFSPERRTAWSLWYYLIPPSRRGWQRRKQGKRAGSWASVTWAQQVWAVRRKRVKWMDTSKSGKMSKSLRPRHESICQGMVVWLRSFHYYVIDYWLLKNLPESSSAHFWTIPHQTFRISSCPSNYVTLLCTTMVKSSDSYLYSTGTIAKRQEKWDGKFTSFLLFHSDLPQFNCMDGSFGKLGIDIDTNQYTLNFSLRRRGLAKAPSWHPS